LKKSNPIRYINRKVFRSYAQLLSFFHWGPLVIIFWSLQVFQLPLGKAPKAALRQCAQGSEQYPGDEKASLIPFLLKLAIGLGVVTLVVINFFKDLLLNPTTRRASGSTICKTTGSIKIKTIVLDNKDMANLPQKWIPIELIINCERSDLSPSKNRFRFPGQNSLRFNLNCL
jgi:hypothetical protein